MKELLLALIGWLFPARPAAEPPHRNPKRPNCPNCGRELVFIALVVPPEVFHTWCCDCEKEQPREVKRDVVRAREWDEQALVLEVERHCPGCLCAREVDDAAG